MIHDANSSLRSRMPRLGRVLHATGAMRLYPNGDGVSFVWRWWNPASWILAPSLVAIGVFLEGIPETWTHRERFGFRVDPFFIQKGIDPFQQRRGEP